MVAGEARTGFEIFHGFVGGGATRGVGTGAGAGAGVLISALVSCFLSLVVSLLGGGASFSLLSFLSLDDVVFDDDPALEFVDSAVGSFEPDAAMVPFTAGAAGALFVLAGLFVFPVGLAVGTGSVDVLVALVAFLEAGRPQAGLVGGAVDGVGAVRDVEAAGCDLPLSLLDLVADVDTAVEAGTVADPFFPFVPFPAPTDDEAFFSD